ncbi:GNAT family N-acetyltransferase [Erysipelothrix rhusiopathiae]|uniref:GNAT family N-acetyltransferase n=1 Tax=unclassified Erysipelothrix TaxID=2624170 RepID=UPI001378FC30|nr:GNAT family N-acetyltransferase [Erysipelothrix sp. strain 2 (EsS2-7-Brazil)]MBK2404768.1 GNAT family N-acetyltransferase [Erysipelothrix sp. strain 2 (EsS2-7-Brazil)]NBA01317.1 GNAT family N-acetyltransferase [Erysipelothrix rhusiopathiae]
MMTIQIRKAKIGDLPEIMHIIEQAKAMFRDKGIDQWQNGYPNEDTIRNDIKNENGFVILKEQDLVGTLMLQLGDDENYDTIEEGQWNEEGPYAVIHRIAIHPAYYGQKIATHALKQIENTCGKAGFSVVRIDTHKNNLAMNALLMKTGYQLCGRITLKDGGERLAYDKKI